MDVAGAPVLQSPTTMAHEQLASPLGYDGSFPLPSNLEISTVVSSAPKRRPSKGHASGAVKRSLSSPNVRSLATASDTSLSLSEKRRNRLGYHRTSVACVHCRRRKIRCLLAPDDPQSRCSNCIRLKKECNFYPVDQQPVNERRPRTGSKMEIKGSGGSVSSSSSPNVATSRAGDQSDAFAHFQVPQPGYPPSAISISSATVSPPGSAAPHLTRFDLPEQPAGGWDMRFFDGPQMPISHSNSNDEHSHDFWKVPDTPLTPGSFSSYASAPPTGMMAPQYPPPWHPVRSMSYGTIDEQAHHPRHDSQPGAGAFSVDHMRRSTIDMPPPAVPPPLGTPLGNENSHQASQMGFNNMSHSWGMLPTHSPKSMDFGSTGWYAEPNPLAKVQEDEISQFGDMQAGMYAGR